MDGASTDATLVVDLGVGASTGTPTPALTSDVPQSPASPSNNGDPSTPRRPILTIDPRASPTEHHSRANKEHTSTSHSHFSNPWGDEIVEVAREGEGERALAPILPPAPNISLPSGSHWTDVFGVVEPSEAEVSSPDARLRAASTSSTVSQARRPRVVPVSSPHWTDGLRSDRLPTVPLPPSTESVEQPYILPDVIVSPLEVSFELDGRENIGGPPALGQDVMKPRGVEVPPDEPTEQVENAVPFGPRLRNDALLDRFVVTSGPVDPTPPLPCDQHEDAAQETPPLRSRLAARLKIRVPEISKSISHIGQRAREMLHVPKLTVVASAYAPDRVTAAADGPRDASIPAGGCEDVDDWDSDNTNSNRRASTTASIASQHGQGCWLCC